MKSFDLRTQHWGGVFMDGRPHSPEWAQDGPAGPRAARGQVPQVTLAGGEPWASLSWEGAHAGSTRDPL